MTVECSAVNGTSISPLPNLRDHCERGGTKNGKSWRMGWSAVKFGLLYITQPLHSLTHGTYAVLHKNYIKSSKLNKEVFQQVLQF